MNDTPPPLETGPAALNRPDDGSGSGKKVAAGCGIGCLVVLILGVVLSVWAFNFTKKALASTVEDFTSESPVELVRPEVEPARSEDAIRRFDQFREEMGQGIPSEPLVLSEEDLNALLQDHPAFSGAADVAVVRIREDRLEASVSVDLDQLQIPIPFLAALVAGRYFNGEVGLKFGTTPSGPSVFLDEVRMGDNPLPPQVLESLRQEDLLADLRSEPETGEVLKRIQAIRIEDGNLIVIPAGGGQ